MASQFIQVPVNASFNTFPQKKKKKPAQANSRTNIKLSAIITGKVNPRHKTRWSVWQRAKEGVKEGRRKVEATKGK